MITWLKVVLYSLGVTGALAVVRELQYIRRRSPPPPLMRQAEDWFTATLPALKRWYKGPKWEAVATEAGLSSMSALSIKLVRDVFFYC